MTTEPCNEFAAARRTPTPELMDLGCAVDRLQPARAAAFRLCAVDGLTERQAAAALGVAGTTVKSALYRAKVDLAAALGVDRRGKLGSL